MKKIIALTIATAALLTGCSTMNQEWHRNCKVQAKDTLYDTTDGNSTRTYRLGTSCGSFNVEDSISGGFNSYDTWNAIEEGKTYDIRSGGYRLGFLSEFPSVLEIKESGK